MSATETRERTGLLGALGRALRPVYDVMIRDPMREGRLRLEGLSPIVRQVAILGLVALGGVLVSLLFADGWRRGELLFLNVLGGRFLYVPVALLAVTLTLMFVGWWLLTWGAGYASRWIEVGVAILFLLLHAPMSRVPSVSLELGSGPLVPRLVPIGYFGVAGVLVAHALLRLRPRWGDRLRPVALGALVLLLAMFFGGHLWSHVLQVRNGVTPTTPLLLLGTLRSIEDVLIPLITLTALVIVQFARNVASAASIPVWRMPALAAKLVLAGLIVLKLWIQLGRHAGEWGSLIAARPSLLIATGSALAILTAATWFAVRNRPAAGELDAARERLVYVGALILSIPSLVSLVYFAISSFLVVRFNMLQAAQALNEFPLARALTYSDAVLWAAILALGLTLFVRRSGSIETREVVVGMLLAGAWAALWFVLELFEIEPPVDIELLDILITGAIGCYLAVRWPRIGTRPAAALTALVLFGWLLFTRGDFVAIVGSLLGLPGVFVVVFGTLFILLTDSAFASGDTRRLPRPARSLLWIGYLLVSLSIANWLTVTHATDLTGELQRKTFFFLGIPLAIWLLSRTPISSPAPDAPEARATPG